MDSVNDENVLDPSLREMRGSERDGYLLCVICQHPIHHIACRRVDRFGECECDTPVSRNPHLGGRGTRTLLPKTSKRYIPARRSKKRGGVA